MIIKTKELEQYRGYLLNQGIKKPSYSDLFNSFEKIERGVYEVPAGGGNSFVLDFINFKRDTLNDNMLSFDQIVKNSKLTEVSKLTGVTEVTEVTELTETPDSAGKSTIQSKNGIGLQKSGYVPEKNNSFVGFGVYTQVKKIINMKRFIPTLITGETGNGKTEAIRQACAVSNRKMIQLNFTNETDETDLIGSFSLIDGDTVFSHGPVVTALKTGAILILDEIDYAHPQRINCLQDILCGHSLFIKQTGELIKPAPGFQIFATANTKGKGDSTGRYIGTNLLNEAFLDRFIISLSQEYPTKIQEIKILSSYSKKNDINFPSESIEDLARWSEMIRTAYTEGQYDENISTRKLVSILDIYSIFGNVTQSIKMAINRFDEETQEIFMRSFNALHG